jgi:protein-S-isoprenylcysteine O-methyltransferase Ste14
MDLNRRVALGETIEFLIIALALFIPAGTVIWLAGWVYLILFIGFGGVATWWLLRFNPELVKERVGFKPNQSVWDKVFIIVFCLLYLAWLIVMPLDAVRYHWSNMPVWLQVLGGMILLYSFYIFYLTFRENPYLSAAVRIQSDRGQTVVSTGPYRYVRHPMYSGAFLYFFGSALMLGSWWGVLFSLIFVLMITVRAAMEERLLSRELQGYDQYMKRVRYRFIPHVW